MHVCVTDCVKLRVRARVYVRLVLCVCVCVAIMNLGYVSFISNSKFYSRPDRFSSARGTLLSAACGVYASVYMSGAG